MNINKVIDLNRYAYENKSLLRTIALSGYFFFLLIFKKYKINKKTSSSSNKKSKFLFYKSMDRADYDILFDDILSACEYSKIIIQSYTVYGFDFSFLQHIKDDFKDFRIIKTNNIAEKLFLFCNYLFYKKLLNQIKEYEFDTLVVFADNQPVESLAVQYFRDMGKKTATLQHGLFLDHGMFVSSGVKSNHNEVNYTNIVSEYFLTWGEENKKLIRKYNKDVKITICGNPTIYPTIKDINKTNVLFFTIMFDSNLWLEYNQKMIDIANLVAKKTKYKFHIRFHPVNNVNDYNIDEQYVINDSNINYHNSQFILAHTGSMIHVCMRQGLVVFKMKSHMPYSYIDSKYFFSNHKDVLDKIENLDEYKTIDYSHIKYIGKESLHQYKLFFDKMSRL